MTGGFLVAVIAVVLTIVVAAPEYAKPAVGAELSSAVASEPSPGASAVPLAAMAAAPTSAPPDKLKGYRWPVRGGMVATYYTPDAAGRFVIDGERIHAGLAITWFEGAAVKAAHKGEVVAAGRDWAQYVGYDGSLDAVYERLKRKGKKASQGVVIEDGNGYRSIYTEIKDLRVKVGDKVKVGEVIGGMSRSEGRQMMRYRLVRSDGLWMRVHAAERKLGYRDYVRELVDPLAVLNLDAKRKPDTQKRRPPANPPRLSDY